MGAEAFLVDVIIPTRNRVAMTLEAVESVRAQTFSSWHLLIVDDASDEPPEALEGMARGDRRISVLRRPRRGGDQAARQTGLEASTAQLIALLDSDDLWDPTKLERQVEHFRARQQLLPDLGAVLCWHQWVDMDGLPQGEIRKPDVDGRAHPLISNSMSTLLARRDAVQRAGGFLKADLPPLHTAATTEFYIRLTQTCAFSVVKELLVRCRHHTGQRATDARRTRDAADAFAYLVSRHDAALKRYPEQRAALLAWAGLRYLAVGCHREGLSYLTASARADGAATFLQILWRYGPFPRRRFRLAAQAVRRALASG